MNDYMIERLTSVDRFRTVLQTFLPCFPSVQLLSPTENDLLCSKLIEHGIVLCLKQDDTIVGFAAFYANNQVTGSAFLSLIAVSPDYRHQGLGRELVNAVCRVSSASGMQRLELQVRADNHAALRFYHSLGFEVVEKSTEVNKKTMEKRLDC